MVERFNRTVKKAIRTAHVEGTDWKKTQNTFLLNYRATPHAMTGVTSARLLFGREIRTQLPEFSKSEDNAVLDGALSRDQTQKAKMKQYSDEKDQATPTNLVEGDRVLLKQPKANKLSTTFDPNAYRVVKRQGTSVLLQRGKEPVIMRNVSWTRKVENSSDYDQQSTDDEHDEVDEDVSEQSLPQQPAPVGNMRPARARKPPARLEDFLT